MARYYRPPFPNPDLRDGFGSMIGRTHPHRGLDFAQPAGAVIHAAADGTVALLEHSGDLGWVTVLRHTRTAADRLRRAQPVFTGYAHQEAEPQLRVGMSVPLGYPIGHVGRQGRSGTAATGEHLHLTMSHELRGVFAGEVFDPWAFMQRYLEPAANPARISSYTVQPHDTLSGIAVAHHTTWQRLAQLNALRNPDHIEAGQVIRL